MLKSVSLFTADLYSVISTDGHYNRSDCSKRTTDYPETFKMIIHEWWHSMIYTFNYTRTSFLLKLVKGLMDTDKNLNYLHSLSIRCAGSYAITFNATCRIIIARVTHTEWRKWRVFITMDTIILTFLTHRVATVNTTRWPVVCTITVTY